MNRVLIAGGAGFVGSQLAFRLKEKGNQHITVYDNLYRKGSEQNVPVLKQLGIEFIKGDVRDRVGLSQLEGNFDVIIDASAEPSVLCGINGSPEYMIDTNLMGCINLLEFCRRRGGRFIFLSTSRVYSIDALRSLPLEETSTRFEVHMSSLLSGLTVQGITEEFPTNSPRSMYGSSKLGAETFVEEYAQTYAMDTVINRCGVIAGPGQFGKVDQGVFTLWVANHIFNRKLMYTGFGGKGKQVRDLLHPGDLFELLWIQMNTPKKGSGEVYNVGGGLERSTSLCEFTKVCERITGNQIEITSKAVSATVDIPYYVTDTNKVTSVFDWRPERSIEQIVSEINEWILGNQKELQNIIN